MVPRRSKPQWWQLYVGLPLLCSLFVFEIDLHLDQTDNIILQLLILGLIFAFVRTWLRANRGSLMELDEQAPERQVPYGVRVYQFPPAEHVAPARVSTSHEPLLDIPQGEIKGVLSTTFEMDAQEADSVFHRRGENARPAEVLPLGNSRHPTKKKRE